MQATLHVMCATLGLRCRIAHFDFKASTRHHCFGCASLQALLPSLLRITSRGRDGDMAFSVLESYALLGGLPLLQPHLSDIAAALQV